MKRIGRFLDWFGWYVLGGIPTGYRRPIGFLLRYGPYRWGMALVDRRWLKSY